MWRQICNYVPGIGSLCTCVHGAEAGTTDTTAVVDHGCKTTTVFAQIVGLGPGPVCTGSTTVLAEGAARVPVL